MTARVSSLECLFAPWSLSLCQSGLWCPLRWEVLHWQEARPLSPSMETPSPCNTHTDNTQGVSRLWALCWWTTFWAGRPWKVSKLGIRLQELFEKLQRCWSWLKRTWRQNKKTWASDQAFFHFFFCLYRGFGCNAYLNPVRAAVDSAGIAQKLDWNGAQTPCQTRKIAQKKADIWGMYYIATGTIYLVIPSITYCNISYIRRLHHITYIYILVISWYIT